MSIIQIDIETLKTVIIESVREAIKAERIAFSDLLIPEVSIKEMQDIIEKYGEFPSEKDYIDGTEWLNNENRVK